MNKELEAWQKIKSGYICGQGAINEFALRENERENFKIIENALKRLEGYESHTTLTMVNQIKGLRDENEELRKRLNEMYELREKYRSDEKKLKAYEIIINNFDFDFDDETLTISMPYDLCENDVEEYELLKEPLL